MRNKAAKFVTFEGCEGSGKTTQSKKLYDYLISQNIPVILTREIGGTKEAEAIRKIIVHADLFPMSELLLIMAARYEHVNKVIIPALAEGKWVICDRFIDSTLAYQGMSIINGFDLILDMHEKLIQPCFNILNRSFMPDITFFIDLPIGIGLSRTYHRNDNNKFEEKEIAFHTKVYNQFHTISNKFLDRMVIINCLGLSKKQIHKKILIEIFRGYEQNNNVG